MDKSLRNTLRNVVTQCRRLLEDTVSEMLEGQFGIFKDGRVEDDARMGHLSPQDRDYRTQVLAHLDHIHAGGFKPADAIAQLTREAAFTHLNRLCAYKMMESRGLIREAVSRGINSNGFKFYLADHDEAERLWSSGQQETAYRMFLEWLADERSTEIGVLFSPNDPANRLFPPYRTLTAVLDLINGEELQEIWTSDEAIGWVYQYFTPKELRDQARKESKSPRNSYELSFRNQFFTPRYVVEFLIDNTLGRIWYEMRQGQTDLTKLCRYMVCRPDEIIPARDKKDPREICVIDPACGSGHFLLYCFDLLEVIYTEAYDDPDLGEVLREDYLDRAAYLRAIPSLILEKNLHGIDIDLRATQIAALALWLRAQRTYSQMKLKAADRPQIRRSHIVCAEPMPGEADLLDEFASRLSPSALGRLVKKVFEKMELAGEAGSLLKIEEEIATTVAEAKRLWVKEQQAKQLRFPGFDEPVKPTQLDFDFSDMTDDEFWQEAETSVIEALRSYSQSATNGLGFKRQLFADDAARGFAFVDVSRKHYDVALMNPPFGAASTSSKAYIEKNYPNTKNDIYAAFVERWIGKLSKGGLLGAITSRTGFFLSSFQKWREEILLKKARPTAFADLGYGVLDAAMVETAAYCIERSEKGETIFFRLLSDDNKAESLTQSITALRNGQPTPNLYSINPKTFDQVPGSPFAYWVSDRIRRLFIELTPFESDGRTVRVGLQTSDDFRFVRTWWEIPSDSIRRRWFPYAKGGTYVPYYADVHLVVNWENDGHDIKEYNSDPSLNYGHWSRNVRNVEYYFRSGIVFPRRTKQLSPKIMAAGTIFSVAGQVAFMDFSDLAWGTAILSSKICNRLISLSQGTTSQDLGGTNPQFEVGLVKNLPWPNADPSTQDKLSRCTEELHKLIQQLNSIRENCWIFQRTAFLTVQKTGLMLMFADWQMRVEAIERQLIDYQNQIDDITFELYDIDGADRAAIESSLNIGQAQPTEELDTKPEDEIEEDELTSGDLRGEVANLLSHLVGCLIGRWDIRYATGEHQPPELPDPFTSQPACSPGMLLGNDGLPLHETPSGYPLQINWDGVLVDDPQHSGDIIQCVRDALGVIWGERTEAIEREACEILSVKELRDYIRTSGKGGFWLDHVTRYSKSRRKAPIYWLLQSSKKNYGIWLYYHRLDKDMLYKVLLNYVEPKIRLEESNMQTLQTQRSAAGNGGSAVKQLDKALERQEAFVSELHDFADKLRRAADLHLEPDLNDGVVLNIAPLWELVPWSEAKKYWDELKAGKYEWSSIGKQLRERGIVKG